MITQLPTVELFGLQIVAASEDDFWRFLRKELGEWRKNNGVRLLMTPNPEQIMLAESNRDFKADLEEADFLIPDGAGLVWASKYFYNLKLRERKCEGRIAGSDTVAKIIAWSKKEKWKVLVVGGYYEDKVVKGEGGELGEVRMIKMENGEELGWIEGYERVAESQAKEEEEKTRMAIESWRPDIVLVAFGAPWQERWLVERREFLTENGVRLGMAIGGSVDFLTGKVARAPKIMQKSGTEWLFRLIKQPWRWQRQLALGKFLGLVADEANKELRARTLRK